MSGTNCHVVIEEAPPLPVTADSRPVWLIPLSAKTPEALRQRIDDLLSWLDGAGRSQTLDDIGYTLQIGRSHFGQRRAVIAGDIDELRERLTRLRDGFDADESAVSEKIDKKALRERLKNVEEVFAAPGSPDSERYPALLDELREIYLASADIDWARLYPDAAYRRISMPAYPFVRERYWVAKPVEVAAKSESQPAIDPADVPIYYQPVWEAEGDAQVSPLTLQNNDTLLIFDVDQELFQTLQAELGAARVMLVLPGAGWRRVADQIVELDPATAADYVNLFENLHNEKRRVSHVLHLWPARLDAADQLADTTLSAGLYYTFSTIQAAARHALNALRRFWYVHRYADGLPQPFERGGGGFRALPGAVVSQSAFFYRRRRCRARCAAGADHPP